VITSCLHSIMCVTDSPALRMSPCWHGTTGQITGHATLRAHIACRDIDTCELSITTQRHPLSSEDAFNCYTTIALPNLVMLVRYVFCRCMYLVYCSFCLETDISATVQPFVVKFCVIVRTNLGRYLFSFGGGTPKGSPKSKILA